MGFLEMNVEDIETIHEYGLNENSRSIYISSQNETEEIDSKTAYTFIKNLHYLDSQSSEPITIWASSNGGDVSLGFAMYDALRQAKSPTIYIATGLAASMGTIILQAATVRLITRNTDFLIHEGTIYMGDTEPKTASSTIKSLRLSVNRFYEIYLTRCKNSKFFAGKTDKWIKGYLKKLLMKNGDLYLAPSQILEYGFADGILGEGKFSDLDNVINSVYSNRESEYNI